LEMVVRVRFCTTLMVVERTLGRLASSSPTSVVGTWIVRLIFSPVPATPALLLLEEEEEDAAAEAAVLVPAPEATPSFDSAAAPIPAAACLSSVLAAATAEEEESSGLFLPRTSCPAVFPEVAAAAVMVSFFAEAAGDWGA
jgi:hypothetical protein